MARRKPKNLYPIKDLKEANITLGEIKEIKRKLEAIEHELNDKIDRAKAEAEAKAAPLKSRMEALENGLLAFSEFNKEELFKKKKSVELAFGSLGYRLSTKLKPMPKTTWKMVLEMLQENGFKETIRVKKEVDREILSSWPDERLQIVGVRRVREDNFWYELKEEELAN